MLGRAILRIVLCVLMAAIAFWAAAATSYALLHAGNPLTTPLNVFGGGREGATFSAAELAELARIRETIVRHGLFAAAVAIVLGAVAWTLDVRRDRAVIRERDEANASSSSAASAMTTPAKPTAER